MATENMTGGADDRSASDHDETSHPGEGSDERFVVFLRHGIAEDRTDTTPDEERSLTPKGHARMKKGARGLRAAFPKVRAIYSSPLLRAVQTALWVSRAYGKDIEIQTTDALLPEATEEVMVAFIESLAGTRAILVGHEPSMSAGLMALLELSGRTLELGKGGACAVRLGSDGERSMEWLLSSRVLRRLSKS